MSAGTLKLTNNSDAVVGTSTVFTTDLKPNDFIFATVGGVTYVMAVKTVTNNTNIVLTRPFLGPTTSGVAWSAVPASSVVGISVQVAEDTAYTMRMYVNEAKNWLNLLTVDGDVTVTAPDGSSYTGPSWFKLAKIMSTIDLPVIQGISTQVKQDAAKVAADKGTTKTYMDSASASKAAAAASETAAGISATSAADSLAHAQELIAVPFETAPFPDVWLPLNDDLRLLAGFAPYDQLTISGQVLELPTKSATFARSTTATYIDKSGVLQTAAINEPRFEKEGLLIEGQGTNLVPNSQLASSWRVANTTVTQAAVISPDGTTNGVTRLASAGVPNVPTGSAISVPISGLSIGGYCSFSVFAKADSHNLIQLRWLGGTTGVSNKYLNVDLSTGEIGANDLFYAKAIPMANGWWRIIGVTSIDGDLTGNTSADPGVELIGSLTDGRRPAVSLATGVGVYLYGPQLESGVGSSYVPTSGAAATRAKESLTLTPVGNIGYNAAGDLFNRTLSFEISVSQYINPVGYTYFRMLQAFGATYDIFMQLHANFISSYRSTNNTSPVISIEYPFSRKIFTQTIDSNNTLTAYFNDQIGSRIGAPSSQTSVPSSILADSNPSVVYHIRNFRIWHRLLTQNQVKGLR